ncbi:MAG: adenylosuccinate synthase [Candidatus Acetothermia bacterium]|jgi:adenylosuccinate synthase|nr:adenylosuccinate synthase [Candidatus Acetothermia bacterium]MDH7505517.1 adenylosuccinate synthase [Candidatus Acetothermia bacterium]
MPAIAVLGAQWGDESKGKVSHLLAAEADWCVRFNGGTNAGHTVVLGGRVFKFHLLPAGSLREGCKAVLGNGMVVDPLALVKELEELKNAGCNPEVYISAAAHLVLPHHRLVERLSGAEAGIGTTGRGIGPAYRDKADRTGLRAGDLREPVLFRERLERNLRREQELWRSEELKSLDPRRLADEVLEAMEPWADRITNTAALLNRALDRGERVIFEGAQGTLLDVDFGTYPYVTSSSTTIGGVGTGAGVSPRRVERVIGVVKAYTTRVGEGPFPTEERSALGDRLRERGREWGVTTGRPRRCGWLDLVALKYAQMLNGFTELSLMKLDVLSGLPELRVATSYRCRGELVSDFPAQAELLRDCEPVYQTLPGWREEIGGCRQLGELPARAQAYISFVEEHLGVPVSIVSLGPGVETSILRASAFSRSR